MIYQHAIPLVRNMERDILVGNLAGRSAVFVPHLNSLAIFHKRSEPLPQPVHILIHINQMLLYHIFPSCI